MPQKKTKMFVCDPSPLANLKFVGFLVIMAFAQLSSSGRERTLLTDQDFVKKAPAGLLKPLDPNASPISVGSDGFRAKNNDWGGLISPFSTSGVTSRKPASENADANAEKTNSEDTPQLETQIFDESEEVVFEKISPDLVLNEWKKYVVVLDQGFYPDKIRVNRDEKVIFYFLNNQKSEGTFIQANARFQIELPAHELIGPYSFIANKKKKYNFLCPISKAQGSIEVN